MSKIVRIGLIIFASILIACLIGLMVTGYQIGWGPFAQFQRFKCVTYPITDTEYKYVREKRTIEGPNGMIVGNLFTPETEADAGRLVILSHGLSTTQWQNMNTANSLAHAGVRVFIFDYCGGAIHSQSEGKTTDMSVITEKADLNAVIDAVKAWKGVDPNKIGIIGYSQGGFVAALTAAERDDIDRLCLIYPALSMFAEIRGDYPDGSMIPEQQKRNGMLVGKRYYQDIIDLQTDNIYEYVASYTGPVMIQHGTADAAVPYESSVAAAAAYPNCEFITLEGASHGFTGEDDVYSVQKEYEFFTRQGEAGGTDR